MFESHFPFGLVDIRYRIGAPPDGYLSSVTVSISDGKETLGGMGHGAH